MFKFVRNKASLGMNNLVAALLATGVRVKKNKINNLPTRIYPADKFIVNWGSTKPIITDRNDILVLNPPNAVKISSDKILTFMALTAAEVPHVEVNHSFVVGQPNPTVETFIARSVVNGHSGIGCTVVKPGDTIPLDTKLMTKYVKPQAEYRVHVFGDEVILLAQKRRRSGTERSVANDHIRSWNNGWVFSVNNVDEPGEALRDACIAAVAACNLDFAGVDAILDMNGSPVILEVNSAPGIEGQSTVDAYANAFLSLAA